MAILRCKQCSQELDKDMLDAGICFNCGEKIEKEFLSSSLAKSVLADKEKTEKPQYNKKDEKIVCAYCDSLLDNTTLEHCLCPACREYIDISEMSDETISQIKKQTEEQLNRKAELERRIKEIENKKIIVTTGDLKEDYDVIGPVYFQLSNKGIFNSSFNTLYSQYKDKISLMKSCGLISREQGNMDWGWLIYGEFSAGQNQFESAFFISVEELKKRARLMDADAIIAMRQDIDIDTNGFAWFYLQMYGTAVKFKDGK